MKIDKIKDHTGDKLLLVFAGWSASPALFRHLEGPGEGTDLWICYDYRDLTFEEDLSGYREIDLIAWSLGVWAASVALKGREAAINRAIAVNGTLCPVHDRWGIPEAIFRGTLDNVTEEGMRRFNRRMYGKREIQQACETADARPLDEIRNELQQLYLAIRKDEPAQVFSPLYNRALLSSADRIFPAENLRAFWQGRLPVTEVDAPHYPFHLWSHWDEIWK